MVRADQCLIVPNDVCDVSRVVREVPCPTRGEEKRAKENDADVGVEKERI